MKEEKSNWILIVFILTFILSVVFSFVSNVVSTKFPSGVLFILLLLTIGIGVLFDLIGTAAISANEATFHAKAANKIYGSKKSIELIKNANRTSSICNDVVGDICGIISGALAAGLIIMLWDTPIFAAIITAIVSSLTVGFKAIGKKMAIKHADNIVEKVGIIISRIEFKRKEK